MKSMKQKYTYNVQVPTSHYRFEEYVTQERWNSYYHQIATISELAGRMGKQRLKILIIGVGEKTVDTILRKMGHRVTTFDIDPALGVDLVGTLPEISARKVGMYDCILCCEVLEHIRYADVEKSLHRFSRIAPYAVLSVPHKSLWLSVNIKFWFFRTLKLIFSLPLVLLKHRFNGEHYWELGTMGYPVAKFRRSIGNSGYDVLHEFRVSELPWHHFFVVGISSTV